ncbi:MAG: 50S ribosomal protein L3 N(5)-glutamine methyltransferase, partial [Halomonas sp.]|nr:50S ribosomal protein L3 N(5)-glutamine methyltransferase [Halomonas sp.]
MAESLPDASSSTLVLSDEALSDGLVTLRDCLRWAASEFHLAGLHYGHG